VTAWSSLQAAFARCLEVIIERLHVGSFASKTARRKQAPVQVHDLLRAGSLMKIVHVLSDNLDARSACGQLRDRTVTGVGFGA
jgi:hypothetical protein